MKDIINTMSLLASILAFFISVFSVFYTKTIKSYEILINERMHIYQKIKDCFQNLKGLTNKYYILKCCEQNKSDDYCQQLRDEYNRLESLLSQTEPQEFFLIKQVKKLIDMVVGICESFQQCNDLNKIEKEAEITFLFADIYCWTLWMYVQGLYKCWGRLGSYHGLFDKNFKKVYKRAKRLHMNQIPGFFYNYPLKKILGKKHKFWHYYCCEVVATSQVRQLLLRQETSAATAAAVEGLQKRLNALEEKMDALRTEKNCIEKQRAKLYENFSQFQMSSRRWCFSVPFIKKKYIFKNHRLDIRKSGLNSEYDKLESDIKETEKSIKETEKSIKETEKFLKETEKTVKKSKGC